jgi:hypothetical protein
VKKAVAELPKARIPRSALPHYRHAGDNISPRCCPMYSPYNIDRPERMPDYINGLRGPSSADSYKSAIATTTSFTTDIGRGPTCSASNFSKNDREHPRHGNPAGP